MNASSFIIVMYLIYDVVLRDVSSIHDLMHVHFNLPYDSSEKNNSTKSRYSYLPLCAHGRPKNKSVLNKYSIKLTKLTKPLPIYFQKFNLGS